MTTNPEKRQQQWRESKARQRAGKATSKPGPAPLTGTPMVRTNITVPESTLAALRDYGNGSVSKAVRKLAEKKFGKPFDKS